MFRLIWMIGFFAFVCAKRHQEWEYKIFIESEYETEYSRHIHDALMSKYDYFTNSSLERWNDYLHKNTLKMQYEYRVYREWFSGWKSYDIADTILREKIYFAKNIKEAILGPEASEFTVVVDQLRRLRFESICPIRNQTCKEGSKVVMDISGLNNLEIDHKVKMYNFLARREQSSSKKGRQLWTRYLELSEDVDKGLGYKSVTDHSLSSLDITDIEHYFESFWEQSHPLLMNLHNFLVYYCQMHYGKDKFDSDYFVPYLHLDLYQSKREVPFPLGRFFDITIILYRNNYTLHRIGRLVNDFYLSLGLQDVMVSMGNDSVIIEHPLDNMDCHSNSNWDMNDKKTYRLIHCGLPNMDSLFQLNRKLGRIQYSLLYKEQPVMFRKAANKIFEVAFAETFLLSIYTQKYFVQKRLIDKEIHTSETQINKLMIMAKEKLLFLPYAYLVEKWRLEVVSGKVSAENWNKRWWELRRYIQKVTPPVNITEEHLDPLTEFHISYDQHYINDFIATFLQFQLHRGFCMAAGEYTPNDRYSKPLHECNYYGNKEIGSRIKLAMGFGRSSSWKRVLYELIEEDKLSADGIIEYFEPLLPYLAQRKESGVPSHTSQSVYLLSYLICFNLLLY